MLKPRNCQSCWRTSKEASRFEQSKGGWGGGLRAKLALVKTLAFSLSEGRGWKVLSRGVGDLTQRFIFLFKKKIVLFLFERE